MKKLLNESMGIFKDMLKERGKWSQGRIYLLWSVLAYYITLGILLVAGLHKVNEGGNDVDVDKFEIIIEALKYAMMLFGGYVFGGKFLDVVKILKGEKPKENEN